MESAAGRVEPSVEPSLFARKATGLVKGWAVRDAFIYAFFSINLVTLGFFIFTYAVFIPEGSLMWAVLLSGGYLILQAVTYASLVAAMPRAGGDYVWISRMLGGGIGFVLAACGWWFILWHWVPIYANILNVEVIVPLSAIVGWDGGVTFFSEDKGLFWASIITAVIASLFIALGIRTYARIQKFCFYGGLLGLAFMFVLLLVNSKTDFISALNTQSQEVLGTGPDTYQGTIDAGAAGTNSNVGAFGPLSGVFLLVPFIVFFNLWSNWGATLYGEVRGASDFRKNIGAMGGALVATTILAVISLLLFAKTFGWDFYNAANNGYWGQPALFDYVKNPPLTFFAYPGLPDGRRLLAVPPRRAAVAVVLRLGRDGLPVFDAGRVRDRFRSRASRGRGEGEPKRRPLRGAGPDADPGDPDQLVLRVQRRVLQLDARGDDGHRHHLRRLRDRGRHTAVAKARDLQRVPDREVRRRGNPADHDHRDRIPGATGVLPLQVDPGRRVRPQRLGFADLHGHPVRGRLRDLLRVPLGAPPAGNRHGDGAQGDPRRVAVAKVQSGRADAAGVVASPACR
jgi:Amino acid permease